MATDAHLANLPPMIFKLRCGDCSAFNAGFVFALHAFGIPARISLGFKYGKAVKQACGSVVAPHAQAEFFAEGIGWIPCDATLGLKRLGHDPSSVLSFVQWRPAALSLAEAEEQAQLMAALPADPVAESKLLSKELQEALGKPYVATKDLAVAFARARGLEQDVAVAVVRQVVQLSGICGGEEKQSDESAAVSVEDFVRSWAAIELGKFKELGVGAGLTASSKAGVKMYEGGPYSGEPLDVKKLKENMMVQDDIERVMGHLGKSELEKVDWCTMWPYGVFLVSYEFEEKALP
mmetsp:Transcript_46978/g.149895  ORF Transcript_46978/g.149895 Transcript_46978/m.149895 type:complete len:292 (+) Transcript_46978:520-1395(+)